MWDFTSLSIVTLVPIALWLVAVSVTVAFDKHDRRSHRAAAGQAAGRHGARRLFARLGVAASTIDVRHPRAS